MFNKIFYEFVNKNKFNLFWKIDYFVSKTTKKKLKTKRSFLKYCFLKTVFFKNDRIISFQKQVFRFLKGGFVLKNDSFFRSLLITTFVNMYILELVFRCNFSKLISNFLQIFCVIRYLNTCSLKL